MRSQLPSTLLLAISASGPLLACVTAQKVHWDGPEAKNSNSETVINAQGTTNWVKYKPVTTDDSGEAVEDAEAEE